jgi:restriction system protein
MFERPAMYVNALLAHDWAPLAWLALLPVFAGVLKSRWAKGHIGEGLVRLAAHLRLPQRRYRRLHNVTLDTATGTTQIDHVFIARQGIFVVETKNMRGWIFGDEQQPQWTQQFAQRSFAFQNPLRQNYKHVMTLQATLGVELAQVHSVVSFVGSSRFKTPMPANVTQGAGFIRHIKSFRQKVFTQAEVDALYQALLERRRAPTRATQREHIRNVKRRADPARQRPCPACGQAMVVRTIKTGARAGQQFWGCSGYPRCRASQDL